MGERCAVGQHIRPRLDSVRFRGPPKRANADSIAIHPSQLSGASCGSPMYCMRKHPRTNLKQTSKRLTLLPIVDGTDRGSCSLWSFSGVLSRTVE
jgi:hypothetical protein